MKEKLTDNVDITQTTHISLCSGYGGIDLGLRRVIQNLRTVAYAEIEAFACENLLARMENGQLDAAPIWSDLKSFPWAEFSGKVDILSGGYPCQPFSAAGKRAGKDDPRHLWPWIADGIAAMRPRVCFFENVEGHISLGLSSVISDLEEMGYRVSWGIFSAAECGAPHQRKRVFILAHCKSAGLERYDGVLSGCGEPRRDTSEQAGQAGWSNSSRDVWPSRPGELADTTSGRCDGQHSRSGGDVGQWTAAQNFRPEVANSSGCGTTQAWPSRPGEPQYAWEPPRVVADTKSKRANRGQQLCDAECGQGRTLSWELDPANEVVGNAKSIRSAALGAKHEGLSGQLCATRASGEGVVGNADSTGSQERSRERGTGVQRADADGGTDTERQAEPALGGDADGAASGMDYAELCESCDNRTDELRLLGNGVVPATSALAFETLWNELSSHPA